jgi:hypothetical protein
VQKDTLENKMEDVTGGWRKFHDEELHLLHKILT